MRILVTGTGGFIGSAVAQLLLQAGHDVCGVDNYNTYYDVELKKARTRYLEQHSTFIRRDCDIVEEDAIDAVFNEFKPERIIHLAAQAGVRYSLEAPRTYIKTNVVGTYNIVELARTFEVDHLLMASTSSAYGANKKYPSQENDKSSHPLTIYSATKLATEHIGHSYANLFHTPTTMLRFFTVYGPWCRPDLAIYKFTKGIVEGTPIDVYNHGEMFRDFTYIDDIARGVVELTDVPPEVGKPISDDDSLSPVAPFRVVNIGSENTVPLMKYIEEIEKNLGRKGIYNMMDMQPGDVPKSFSDTSLLHALTGFKPQVRVEEGVKNFVAWYRDYHGVS